MYQYFKEPHKYAFLEDQEQCDFCKKPVFPLYQVCDEDYNAVCDECLKSGILLEHDIWMNVVNNELPDAQIIEYKTPPIPTWQDLGWPVVNNKFCKFIKIADKHDFSEDINKFKTTALRIVDEDLLNDLWEFLPENPVTCLKNGDYNISFYLFESEGNLYWLYDAC
jgi:hypothetical protein